MQKQSQGPDGSSSKASWTIFHVFGPLPQDARVGIRRSYKIKGGQTQQMPLAGKMFDNTLCGCARSCIANSNHSGKRSERLLVDLLNRIAGTQTLYANLKRSK